MVAVSLNHHHRDAENHVMRYMVGALFISPVMGGLIGGFLGGIGFVTGYHSSLFSEEMVETFRFGFDEGIFFGVLTGLIFGLMATWPLRNQGPWRVIGYLGGGTLLFALPFAIMGIPPVAWFMGMFGFWVGWVMLIGKSKVVSNEDNDSENSNPSREI